MKDLVTMALVREQLPLIKEILTRFGRDIEVTHISQTCCNESSKSFCGFYQGSHYTFDWHKGVCIYSTWEKDNESIRVLALKYGMKWGTLEDFGDMIYVGDVA